MKKFIYLLFFPLIFHSQIFTSDFVATYDIDYPIYGAKNSEQMLLLMNSQKKQSYYISSIFYAEDSLSKKNNLKEFNQNIALQNSSAFEEQIFFNGNSYQYFESIIGVKLKYSEPQKIKWKLLNEKKVMKNVIVRKAETYAYGRKWTAWYTEEIALFFGPYKFGGLPGFIIQVYDDKNEYNMYLTQFKKKKMTVPLPNEKKYKTLSKQEFKKTRYDIKTNINNLKLIFKDPLEKRKFQESMIKKYKEEPVLDLD